MNEDRQLAKSQIYHNIHHNHLCILHQIVGPFAESEMYVPSSSGVCYAAQLLSILTLKITLRGDSLLYRSFDEAESCMVKSQHAFCIRREFPT